MSSKESKGSVPVVVAAFVNGRRFSRHVLCVCVHWRERAVASHRVRFGHVCCADLYIDV